MNRQSWLGALLMLTCLVPCMRADALDDLGRDFWSWRAVEMPVSTDDIPRLDRPSNWVPDWSPAAVEFYRTQVSDFEKRWRAIDASQWPVARQVDYRLIGSAIARARWELDHNGAWKKNPNFYVDQTLGAYFHLLLAPPPFSQARGAQIVATLKAFPKTLGDAHKNLTEPVGPFAQLALDQLKDIRPRLLDSVAALKPSLDHDSQQQIDTASANAAQALEEYREWLAGQLASMSLQTAIGREGYVYFLKNVALLPYSPEQLLEIGRVEWGRSVAFQTYEEHRNLGLPNLPMAASLDEEIAWVQRDEAAIRKYLVEKQILSVPTWMQHYTWQAMQGM
jgi:hypothetical protein